MSKYNLDGFISDCRKIIQKKNPLPKTTLNLCQKMHRLLTQHCDFLDRHELKQSDEHYCRNLIYLDPNHLFSLYALVWLPNQWTPIHDHGTWGIVGVHSGVIQEQNFVRTDTLPKDSMEGIELSQAGHILLSPGSTTSFVPTPDHIHKTGNPNLDEKVISLHLYGNAMAGFNIYDLEAQSRTWHEVSHE